MREYIRFQNPFLVVCEQSFITTMQLSVYHDTALSANKSDPDILALYTPYHVIHVDLEAKYNLWKTQEALQQEKTLALELLMEKLSREKANDWDLQTQLVYNKNTPRYKGLFPDHRKPFQRGKQLERIHAVQQLSTAIGADTALATLKTDVDAFYAQIQLALNEQKESLNTTKVKSNILEAARKIMCIAQFANYGALIKKFAATPEKLAEFFEMTLIRATQQSSFTGYIKPEEIRPIAKRTLNADDQVIFSNLSPAVLKLYLAKMKGDVPGTKFVELGKGETTVSASALGDLTNPFLTLLNTDPNLIGKFELVIM